MYVVQGKHFIPAGGDQSLPAGGDAPPSQGSTASPRRWASPAWASLRPWKTSEATVQPATRSMPISGRPALVATVKQIRFGLRRAVIVRKSVSIGRQLWVSKPKPARKAPSRARPTN